MKSITLASAAVLSLTLAGCGHSEIDTVKAATVPQDSTHTYGTTLSNRASCVTDSWRTFKDDTNRTVVEYRCELKNGAALLAALRQQKIIDTQHDFQGYFNGLDQTTERASHEPEAAEKELADARDTLAQLQSQADAAKSNAAASGDPRALRQAMVNQDDVAAAQRAVEQAQQHLDDAKRTLASLPQDRARLEQQEKVALAQIDNTYGGITQAREVFQWFVRDTEVVPAWAGVELTRQDGNTARQDRNWRQTMWDLLNRRGDDHVRAVLNVPDNIASGQ
ncbi:hypothetical protein GCT19_09515 [Paraburkholderia sp. CNPSo 3155]|uniref:hypothetical protein n=1 Tax=Paraburkholderia atlantica TaxID=2654982 RepID=UPI00128DD833|nr:hypothetical protein [Paraburkholderia atlantica]MPW05881.1 hypothetical protein [Paraburkholderia atlantica]